jgi:hypothetical protein
MRETIFARHPPLAPDRAEFLIDMAGTGVAAWKY